MVGETVNMLTVLEFSHRGPYNERHVRCACACGRETVTRASAVKRGRIKSCGCLLVKGFKPKGRRGHREARKRRVTTEYCAWTNMKQRCSNPNHNRFEHYGGRGIRVCDRWLNSYENFLADMGRKPNPAYSIDRIDNDGNYEPGNCRWATAEEQAANKQAPNGLKAQ